MTECRCVKCNKLLFKLKIGFGLEVEIKCDRCGTINVVRRSASVNEPVLEPMAMATG